MNGPTGEDRVAGYGGMTAVHELSIVRQFMAAAEAELERVKPRVRPIRLKVLVGRLSGASPEAIRFAFDVLAPHGGLKGCRLDIVEPRARCVCETCNSVTEIQELVVSCPACGASSVRIEGGQELRLESIEVAD